ncbi:PREDICTED: uncharacterized protein LOC107187804 [Dufourea novaeangliae]|uniref:Uncharacterized protein n=1 Tax=Dufourea novaeangliae TaxID=178035 RepID=A0A154PE76_DUFNO|nr:PREDICTED: uncharacterized protein LOC107187804 [Dufourea novaeangliae]KZC09724.1 hypothetical protein WN55_00859 [Dufourea novaeangliae]
MKSNVTLHDRLIKQNEINRQRLARELVKLEKVEKSDLRMIETERHRFRSRHKNLESRQPSTGSNAINVRMYDTHNPGFCYHCTGAIKECGITSKEKTSKDSYDFVHSMIFTNSEVDPLKVLCLHLLTAHTTKWNNNDSSTVRPVTPLLEKAKQKRFSGAWNNSLPCYVVDTEDASTIGNVKLHEDPRKKILDDQAIHDFEERYRQYMENNDDLGKVLSTNVKNTKNTQQGLQKMPAISPHVYSLLGPSHELRIKQALAVGMSRRKLACSSMELNGLDENSYSFHLDDDDDASSGTTTNESNRNWVTRSTRSPSRRSTIGSMKLDHRFTMLKSGRSNPTDYMTHKSKNYDTHKDFTVQSSLRTMKDVFSITSSTKSPFRGVLGSRPSTSNSLLSASMNPDAMKNFRKCIYLNTSARRIGQRKDYTIVPILVNYQIQALVQTVLDVLERVNPEKLRIIVETARDTEEIRKMLLRPAMKSFVQSLIGQSLLSSPESYVVSVAAVADEMDFRFEEILEKEIIALTLEMPSAPCLNALIAEIRNNIFRGTKKKTQLNENTEEISSAPVKQKVENEDTAKNTLNAMQTVDKPGVCFTCHENSPIADEDKKDHSEMHSNVEKPMKRMNYERGVFSKENDTIQSKVNIGVDQPGMSNEDNIAETPSGDSLKINSLTKTDEHRISSGNVFIKRTANAKSWKAAQDLGHLDADHVILRRMTNTQRILVGQMCASLKSKRINNQGLINESVPLAALITPALSRDSIKVLTRGTVYSKADNVIKEQEETEENVVIPDKITGPLLAKIRQDVAENETKRRLKRFLNYEGIEKKL